MFLVRRVCKVERKDAWQVAKLLRDICTAYENDNGRNSATIYITGTGTPAPDITVCAEWLQDTIESDRIPNVPDSVKRANGEMFPLLQAYDIEFHEVATDDKIAERT